MWPDGVGARLHGDDARGAEVGPGELLLARPDQRDRRPGAARQARGLDGGLAGVLAAVGRARVGHDHPHLLQRQPERLGQLAVDAEGPLGAGPDGQVIALPNGQRGARLQRRVGDVGDGIGRVDRRCGGRAARGQVPRGVLGPAGAPGAGRRRDRVARQIGVERVRVEGRRCVPGGLQGRQRAVRRGAVGRGHAHEVAVVDEVDPGDRLGRGGVEAGQPGAERGRAQHRAGQHTGQAQVGREVVRPGHEGAAVDLGRRAARGGPRARRRDRRVVAPGRLEAAAPGQRGVGQAAAGRRVGDAAAGHGARRPVDAPLPRGQVDEFLARRRGDLAQHRRHEGRAAAAEGAHLEGGARRVAQDHVDPLQRHAQFVGDRLRERGAHVLAHLGLAAVDLDRVVGQHLQPIADGGRFGLAPRRAAVALGGRPARLARDHGRAHGRTSSAAPAATGAAAARCTARRMRR